MSVWLTLFKEKSPELHGWKYFTNKKWVSKLLKIEDLVAELHHLKKITIFGAGALTPMRPLYTWAATVL